GVAVGRYSANSHGSGSLSDGTGSVRAAKPLNLGFLTKFPGALAGCRNCLTMLPIPSFLAPASVCARALNALLSREQWAREHLGRHAGKTVRFAFGEMAAGFAVASDGYVSPGDPAVVP